MESINELAAALAKAQSELGHVTKSKVAKIGPGREYRYADLADVLEVVRKALSKHGIAVVQALQSDGERIWLETRLAHSSGQSLTSTYPISGGTDQAIGSSITYGRRYALSAMVGLAADEDDDGEASTTEAASKPAPKPASKPAPEKPAAPPAPAGPNADCPFCGKTARPSKFPKQGATHYCYECKKSFDPSDEAPPF
jgi:hypothetical protein